MFYYNTFNEQILQYNTFMTLKFLKILRLYIVINAIRNYITIIIIMTILACLISPKVEKSEARSIFIY